MEVHVSVVKQTLWHIFFISFINFNLYSLNNSKQSWEIVQCEGIQSFGQIILMKCLNPSRSTNLKGISSTITMRAKAFLVSTLSNFQFTNPILSPSFSPPVEDCCKFNCIWWVSKAWGCFLHVPIWFLRAVVPFFWDHNGTI